jgi:protein-tyrosine phosphatase
LAFPACDNGLMHSSGLEIPVNDVFWIAKTGLAIVMRPHGDDLLRDELSHLKRAGIQTLISTLEVWEARELGLANEGSLAEELGLHFISYPIRDRTAPSRKEEFDEFVGGLAQRLQAGEKIGVHCRGCIGRSTVVTASTLIKLGWDAEKALDAIELARGCSVPDTEEQREWILDFGAAK